MVILRRQLFSGLCCLMFFSGAAGLVYQVVWSRFLEQVFGVTVYAISAVLATFLGGLAVGAWLLGRWGDRWASPLRLYGLLEIGIGAAAVSGLGALSWLDPLHIWLADRYASSSPVLLGARVLLASAVVVPATLLMGGTLPVLVRAFSSGLDSLGRDLGLLYAVNTLGAVFGTLAAGFWMIRLWGLHTTLWIAAGVNVGLGVCALLMSARWSVHREGQTTSPGSLDSGSRAKRTCRGRSHTRGAAPVVAETFHGGLIVVMVLAGTVALGLEVLWTRGLVLVIGTSAYAFVTVLTSYLAGIAIGSFLARRFVDHTKNLRRLFGWIQLGVAASAMATIPAIRHFTAGSLREWIESLEYQRLSLIFARFDACVLVMLIPTTLMGMTFPVAAKMWTRDPAAVGGQVGQLYAANTAGNIAGALLSAFVVLPLVGLQKGIAIFALLSLVNASWGLFRAGGREGGRWLAPAAAMVVLSGCTVVLAAWNPRPVTINDVTSRVVYYREGVAGTVQVNEDRRDQRLKMMSVDAVKIGQSHGGVDRKQQALAHFPFLLITDEPPRRVLSIGLGTGILIGEVAKHPSVERIDCVEISPEVIEAARVFDDVHGQILDHENVTVICDDGVNFLRRCRTSYDAIISDAKSQKSHAGNSVFFSSDYYHLCRRRLRPKGIFLQWFPLDVPPSELRTMIRTFVDVFAAAHLWIDPPMSAFVVGLEEKLQIDVAKAAHTMDTPSLGTLGRYGWRNVYDFLSMHVADRRSLSKWLAGHSTVNSLEHPVLEFYSPAAYSIPAHQRLADNLQAIRRIAGDRRDDILSPQEARTDLIDRRRSVDKLLKGLTLLHRGDPELTKQGVAAVDEAVSIAPDHHLVRAVAARMYTDHATAAHLQGDLVGALSLYRQASRLAAEDSPLRRRIDTAIAELRH